MHSLHFERNVEAGAPLFSKVVNHQFSKPLVGRLIPSGTLLQLSPIVLILNVVLLAKF